VHVVEHRRPVIARELVADAAQSARRRPAPKLVWRSRRPLTIAGQPSDEPQKPLKILQITGLSSAIRRR